LAENLRRRWKAHCNDGYFAAVLFFDLQGHFEGIEVFRIENSRKGRPIDSPVFIHGLAGDTFGIRHLFCKDYTIVPHGTSP